MTAILIRKVQLREKASILSLIGRRPFLRMYNGNHPFQEYSKQLEILVNDKKLIVKNPSFAVNVLQHYSYYTIINGYKDLFLDKSYKYDRFKDGTTFEMLYQSHWIDMELSSLIFRYSLLVEKKLKTRIGYLLGVKYGELEQDYLKQINYSPSKYNRGKLSEVKQSIDSNRLIDISALHYMKNENNLPPWIATKSISFGSIFTWYSVLKLEDKINIINNFSLPFSKLRDNEKTDIFNRLVGQVYKYRNLSAHGNRSYKLSLGTDYKLGLISLKKIGLDNYFIGTSTNSLYSVILSILILIDDPFAIENFIREINIFLREYTKPQFMFLEKNIYDLFDLPLNFVEIISDYAINKIYREKYYN